jgi:hypothetical protein
MTFEEALAAPGRKVQASREANDGQRVVTIYGLASGGAKELAATTVSAAEHDALVAQLRERGCELADTELLTRIVWIVKADGVEVFDKRSKQFEAAGDRATLKDGRVVARSDFAQVFSWAAEEYAHRGIKAALRSGEEVELVTEISLAATGDPTYNRNDLLMDSGWCTTLGRVIASWAGAGFEDRI